MPRIGPGRLPIVLTLLATAPAPAQQASPDLEPVDQTIEDVSVLSTSLRRVEPGLQQPNDFSRVYRWAGSPDRFMRVQGGLYAVFPESVYRPTKEGQLEAFVPHDTIFHIGPPTLPSSEPPAAAPRPEGLVRGRIDLKVKGTDLFSLQGRRSGRDRPSKINPSPFRSIVSDEAYRQRRLRSLLRRAADHAARGRSSSSSK